MSEQVAVIKYRGGLAEFEFYILGPDSDIDVEAVRSVIASRSGSTPRPHTTPRERRGRGT